MRRFLNKVWGGIKDNIAGIIGGGLIGGPMGILIGIAVQELLRSAEFPLSQAAEREAEKWAEKYFSPFFMNSVEWVTQTNEISNDDFVSKYNQILMQLRSWQAYYEAVMHSPKTSQLDKEVANAKQLILLQAVEIFKASYEEASVLKPSELFFENHEYDPSTIEEVAGDVLAWAKIGVKSVTANNMFLTNGRETPQSELIKNVFEKHRKKLPVKDPKPDKTKELDDKPKYVINPILPKDSEQEKITPPQNDKQEETDVPSLPNISPTNDIEEKTGTRNKGRNLLIGAALTAVIYRMFN